MLSRLKYSTVDRFTSDEDEYVVLFQHVAQRVVPIGRRALRQEPRRMHTQ